MKKYTQKDVNNFEIDSYGYRIYPSGDYTAIKIFGKKCHFLGGCIFGDECSFGERCGFGNECKFGKVCKFGISCYFGELCIFGLWCEFNNPFFVRESTCFFSKPVNSLSEVSDG